MNTLKSLLCILLLATPLVAQNAPIPQDLPRELRNDAVRRKVEQIIPRPLQQPKENVNAGPVANFFRVNRVNAVSVEDRIAALEAKVETLQREIEAQKVLIKQLQELLDQQKKN